MLVVDLDGFDRRVGEDAFLNVAWFVYSSDALLSGLQMYRRFEALSSLSSSDPEQFSRC